MMGAMLAECYRRVGDASDRSLGRRFTRHMIIGKACYGMFLSISCVPVMIMSCE